MGISSNVSLLAQSISQSQRLSSLRANLDDLQRQVSSQKNYDTFAGFGVKSSNLQRMRIKTPMLETYVSNIEKASTSMEQIASIMEQVTEIGNTFTSKIYLREGDASGTNSIAIFAKDNLDFIQDLLNQKGIDGSYLFAGADIENRPFSDAPAVDNNSNNQVTQWLNGTITDAQMITNVNAFDTSALGLSTGLDTTQDRNVRISDSLDVNYGIKANIDGFKDIIRALSLAANIKHPDVADVATVADLDNIFTEINQIAIRGTQGVKAENEKIASKFSLINSIKDNHQTDINLFRSQIDDLENVNPSEVLIRMQILETQLTASYQVTKLMSDLSLTNYI